MRTPATHEGARNAGKCGVSLCRHARSREKGEENKNKVEPPRGIEPLTFSLRVRCSTD